MNATSCCGCTDRTANIQRLTSGRGKKDGDAALSNLGIKPRIQCGKSAHVGDGCRQQHCVQNCDQTVAD